jgi:hypothetical protein
MLFLNHIATKSKKRASHLKPTETFTRSVYSLDVLIVVFVITLWGVDSSALQCKNVFAHRREITPLAQSNVVRFTQGAIDFVYKIFPPGEAYRASAEAESLRMFRHLLQTAEQTDGFNLRLKVVDSARVTSRNEHGVMDFGPQSWLRSGRRLSASITPFVYGREVIKILDDPNVSIDEKQAITDTITAEIEHLAQWLNDHPEYRYRNRRVEILDLDRGDVYDFTSKDGTFYLEYKNWFLVLSGSQEKIIVGLNPVFNFMRSDSGNFILFDPL